MMNISVYSADNFTPGSQPCPTPDDYFPEKQHTVLFISQTKNTEICLSAEQRVHKFVYLRNKENAPWSVCGRCLKSKSQTHGPE